MQRFPGCLILNLKEVVMVWKQDLAKLKQAFPESGGPPPPPVKPKAKPVEVKDLNEEDAFFLAAMGTPPARAAAPPVPAAPAIRVPVPPAPEPAFEAEIADLKGLKPLAKNPLLLQPPPPPLAPPEAAVAAPLPEAPPPPAPAPEPLRERAPLRIQLAAGMAVEVDASLDLRNHSVADALGRLRDRVEDGFFMGWRTLHVTLGEDNALQEALLAFLSEGNASRISRYAQAPIPMGGTQAWVLYY